MGTYLGYYGDMAIPEEKRAEFTERVLKILHQGGMMRRERVCLFGEELTLLLPVMADEEGDICYTYNYFEDDGWETAGYHTNPASFFSNKVGSNEFNAVLRAVYVLYEFYTEKFGLAWENDALFHGAPYIQWLNYLFDEAYTNERMTDLWEVYQLLPDHRKQTELLQLLDTDEINAISITGFLKYAVLSGMKSLTQFAEEMTDDEPEREITLIGCIKRLLNVLKRIREIGGEDDRETLEELKRFLAEEDQKDAQEGERRDYQSVKLLSMLLPKEITVKGIADTFGVSYEDTMADWGDLIQDKSEMWDKGQEPMKPLPPLDTTSFLMQNHRGSARAMTDDTAYRITDDDRAYYWREDGDVRFSEEMWVWLRELRKEWEAIQAEEASLDAFQLLELWFHTLCEVAEVYTHIYCFRDTFYEFMAQAGEPQIQAAVILLKRLVDRNRSERDEETERDTWLFRTRQLDRPERLEIKRYLAVLGNPDLRKEVFGF